jgi:hypothetical protein
VNVLNATARHRLLLRSAVLGVVLACSLGALPRASAQEWVGTEVSATVPSVVLGSSAARFARVEGVDTFVRSAPFAVCDPSRGAYCAGMRVTGVEMNTFPRVKLALDLPEHFTIEGHLWTMTHEEVNRELRQAIMGTTLRRTSQRGWVEAGVGVAERAEAENTSNDPRALACEPGAPEPAVLAGLGTWITAGDHMLFDLRLRGGVSVGDEGADVYHANLVVGFVWQ